MMEDDDNELRFFEGIINGVLIEAIVVLAVIVLWRII